MVVITTSTLNRVMVVELLLPAAVPGLLVMAHYLVQMLRPRMGHGVDKGRKATVRTTNKRTTKRSCSEHSVAWANPTGAHF